ncbi:MAG: hypothetical protein WCH98_02495 [Verrucomicrobiota bacterium]
MNAVQLDGEKFVVIRDVDAMPPFLMSVASSGDVWVFIGSNSPFTAGRAGPEGALFPYQTADKILRHPDSAGVLTKFRIKRGAAQAERLWEPWHAPRSTGDRITRNLYKSVIGNAVVFEEIHHDLEVSFRWSLAGSERFGLVRRCRFTNLGSDTVRVRALDGWHRLLPAGVPDDIYTRFSYLAEAYMRHEHFAPPAIYTLNSRISDRAEPGESLRVACAWSAGHRAPMVLLSDRQVAEFRNGGRLRAETEVRGVLGAYLVADEFALDPGGSIPWTTVADTGLDHSAAASLRQLLADPAATEAAVRESLAGDARSLRARIAAADGLQQTANETTTIHHFSNTLFNCMRGGVPPDGYTFPTSDYWRFLAERSRAVAGRHGAWLAALPERMEIVALRQLATGRGDVDLTRLTSEYLPLTFSRRHGDPSRPWNRFSIAVKDATGEPIYGYQGNWRDIFQNWESLAQSFPALIESMIAVFLNASTADGYNPYRITRSGFEWEVLDEEDPWSNIGYWGDHQIIYLLRLLESGERFFPGSIATALNERRYAHALVPYEIRDFDALSRDPRHSIRFDRELHERLAGRAAAEGNDGRLLRGKNDAVQVFTLAEKLLLPMLVKLTNLVPGGGIWLNTQRPEWNDANNALAGWGLSVVTACHLSRYVRFLADAIKRGGEAGFQLSAPVAGLLRSLMEILAEIASLGVLDDVARLRFVRSLSQAGECHRNAVYRRDMEPVRTVAATDIEEFLQLAGQVLERTVRENLRADGMIHSYNLLELHGESATVRRLELMLEGQVAVLGSAVLTAPEEAGLLRQLRASALYREDQRSYMLYADREVQPFLSRNRIPDSARAAVPLLGALLDAGGSIVTLDVNGVLHFNGDLRNASDLALRLDQLAGEPEWALRVEAGRAAMMALWESVFHHASFTGRSGSMFAFEGLGSIYWHMVAKLLLAVQECHARARRAGANRDVIEQLAAAYGEVRSGLGFCKSPAEYGAFPTDPYSHTPGHCGAQQPGMTGQVKEEILTRFGELGVNVESGCLCFEPSLLCRQEFHVQPACFRFLAFDGTEEEWKLPAGSLAFTFSQVPVCYSIAEAPSIIVKRSDASESVVEGSRLSAADSHSIFARTGAIRRLAVSIPHDQLRPPIQTNYL